MERSELSAGMVVSWWYVPRGGWGLGYSVDAEVVKVNPKKVRIRVKRRGGDLVERNVDPVHLHPREVGS